MNFQFVPLMSVSSPSPICVKKGDYSSYDACNDVTNGILTPTTPSSTMSSKLITSVDNSSSPFFIPPPFQPFSYSNSPPTNNYYHQVSPIEFSPSDKPTQLLYNYNDCNVDECGGYYDNYSNSVIDTPDSIIFDDDKGNQFNEYDDTYFRFDAETIEKFSSTITDIPSPSDILNLDTDYVNFNEDNCNSKNQSPCSSPLDPWIVSNAMIEASHSPKIDNNVQQLPSINQAFSHFQGNGVCEGYEIHSGYENRSGYENHNNILDSFDSSFFEDFTVSNIKSEESYVNPINFNYITFTDDKPNREFKNIWEDNEKPTQQHQEYLQDFDEEKLTNNSEVPITKPKRQKKQQQKPKEIVIEQPQHPDQSELPQQLICFWADCYQEFKTQSALVSHIEKYHVCVIKGEEYTCLWTECPRQYRSFNARYKLLIHMRVHSGEKPNKCPVSRNLDQGNLI
jgi:hypothetical protein